MRQGCAAVRAVLRHQGRLGPQRTGKLWLSWLRVPCPSNETASRRTEAGAGTNNYCSLNQPWCQAHRKQQGEESTCSPRLVPFPMCFLSTSHRRQRKSYWVLWGGAAHKPNISSHQGATRSSLPCRDIHPGSREQRGAISHRLLERLAPADQARAGCPLVDDAVRTASADVVLARGAAGVDQGQCGPCSCWIT